MRCVWVRWVCDVLACACSGRRKQHVPLCARGLRHITMQYRCTVVCMKDIGMQHQEASSTFDWLTPEIQVAVPTRNRQNSEGLNAGCSPSTFANLVSWCGVGGLPGVMMCSTCQPLTSRASLIRALWHRKYTCSTGCTVVQDAAVVSCCMRVAILVMEPVGHQAEGMYRCMWLFPSKQSCALKRSLCIMLTSCKAGTPKVSTPW